MIELPSRRIASKKGAMKVAVAALEVAPPVLRTSLINFAIV